MKNLDRQNFVTSDDGCFLNIYHPYGYHLNGRGHYAMSPPLISTENMRFSKGRKIDETLAKLHKLLLLEGNRHRCSKKGEIGGKII
jgi:hypothetical protein